MVRIPRPNRSDWFFLVIGGGGNAIILGGIYTAAIITGFPSGIKETSMVIGIGAAVVVMICLVIGITEMYGKAHWSI